jgi:hypothetical protein
MVATIDRPRNFQLDYPRSPGLLDKLYDLDCEAYGRHAVDRSILERWVGQNPMSITLLMDGADIAGAFGFLALSEEQCRHFIGGKIGEADLNCLPENAIGCKFWYWSGLVVAPEYRKAKQSPLKRLLMLGIDEWLQSDRRDRELAHVYSLGCTVDGVNLLDRFAFERILEPEFLKDDAPLFYRAVRDKAAGQHDLLEFFRGTERQRS